MHISFFLTWRVPDRPHAAVSHAELQRFTHVVRGTTGLRRALIYTPAKAHDPYLNDGPSPPLAAELVFDDIAHLEAALAPDAHLHQLADPALLPSLADADVTQQAMLARSFGVPQPGFRPPHGEHPCTYLVAYEGEADDLNAWLAHYLRHHPPIMARFPHIREIEICTRIDWVGFLPFRRVAYMQRNKVAFDSAAALDAALNSPVRHEMRADFRQFPPFRGANTHYPMATHAVSPYP